MSDAASAPAPSFAAPARWTGLDALRGLAILAMILVNNPGDWGHIYAPLEHATWNGWTPTDLIFPFFLFLVGASLAFSTRDTTKAAAIRGRAIRNARNAVARRVSFFMMASDG